MVTKRPFTLELQVRKVDFLYRQSLTAPLIIGVCTLLFLGFGWHVYSHLFLVSWAFIFNFTSILRLAATIRWIKIRDSIQTFHRLKRWHRFIAAVLLIVGFCCGIMGYVSSIAFQGLQQISVGMLLLGIISASVAVYAPSLICSLALLIPATLIWAMGPLKVGGFDNNVMAALIFFFFLMQLRLAFNWYRYSNTSIDLNTELHEKEERLRHNRDASGAVDWEWNLVTGEIKCQGALKHLIGTDLAIFNGSFKEYLDFVHPADRALLESALTKATETGQIDAEHRVVWPNGEIHYIALRGRAPESESKIPLRMAGICWNVTSKKVQDQLRHERDLYEASDRAKLMFLANASHEIRTPLAAINGFAELALGRPELPRDLGDDLKTILRNGKYLTSIVNDLLDLSKSEADRLYIQKSTMSPVREINDSLLVVEAAARQKGLFLKTVYETPVPDSIFSDPTRFRQILINLLSNAIKYTNQGGATVRVSYLNESSLLRVVVSDTGIGLNEETRRNLFQPFVRGKNDEVQKVPGSGLGLALSRSLARKMGGDVCLLSPDPASHDQSFFEMTIATGLPKNQDLKILEKNNASTLTSRLEPALASASTQQCLLGKTILLTEDQDDLRTLMRRYLEKYGARVITSPNGADAVNEAFRIEFDAILMDIQMPVMNGFEASALLRSKGYKKPIIALTAHTSTNDREKCRASGCDYYLSKPIDMNSLLALLTAPMTKTAATV